MNTTSSGLFARAIERTGFVIILLVVILGVLGFIEPRFFNRLNQLNVLRNASFLILVAYGQMLVMIAGGFDLSVGAVAALAAITGVTVMGAHGGTTCTTAWACTQTIGIGVAAALLVGALVGFVNGLCVAKGRVSPFMVTLGMLFVVEGITIYWTNGVPVYGIPGVLVKTIGRGTWFDAPVAFWLALAIGAFLWLLQNRMRMGRHLYAVGSNLQAATITGIPAKRILVLAYVLSGVLAALAGLIMATRLGSGQVGIGSSLMIESIAAAVIGGVSLRGGIGKVERVFAGSLLLAVIDNSLNLFRIESKLQTLVMGAVLLIAVSIEQLSLKRNQRV